MTKTAATSPAPPAGYPHTAWAEAGEPFYVPAELREDYVAAAAGGRDPGGPAAYARWMSTVKLPDGAEDALAYEKWAHARRLEAARSIARQRERLEAEEARKVPCPVCERRLSPTGELTTVKHGGAEDHAGLAWREASTGPTLRVCHRCAPVVEDVIRAEETLADGRTRLEAARSYVRDALDRK